VCANDKPGLGVDIDEVEAAKYPCENAVATWRRPGHFFAKPLFANDFESFAAGFNCVNQFNTSCTRRLGAILYQRAGFVRYSPTRTRSPSR
jgi:hypothetical protein